MYEHIQFAEPSRTVTLTGLDTQAAKNEALAACQSFAISPVHLALGEINVNIGTAATVDYAGRREPITRVALEGLCKVLGIPDPFRRRIPVDLLLHNIQSLQVAHPGLEIDILARPEGGISNIVAAPYDEISYSNILSAFLETSTLRKLYVSEDILKLGFQFEEVPVPDMPAVDPWYLGTFVFASLNKLFGLHLLSGFYRTVCENSYYAPIMGKARANYSVKDHDERLLRFADIFTFTDTAVANRLQSGLPGIIDSALTVPRVAQVATKLDSILSPAETNTILQLTEEERKILFSRYREWQGAIRKSKIFGGETPEMLYTNKQAYHTINDITLQGQKLGGITGYKLEKLGGAILQDLILN